MEQSETTPHHLGGGIVNYFQGATIHNIVINGNMNRSGDERYGAEHEESKRYSDEQVAEALLRIVGEGKPINTKKSWAGAYWLLRWEAGYPVSIKDFCNRINRLPFSEKLPITCDSESIRKTATLSFMNEDATKMDYVRYSKNDMQDFAEMREVALALSEELKVIKYQRKAI